MYESKVTFIRIPKNASTSIYEHIRPINTIKGELMPQLKEHEGIFDPTHCTLSQAVKVLGEDILNKICFAVCRNPFDRMVSQYTFTQSQEFIPLKFKDFSEFIDFASEVDSIASHSQSYYLDMDVHIDILRFENLQRDFMLFCAKNKLLINPLLPKKNRTTHKHYTEYYTPKLKEKVKTLWSEDFKRFNYE